MKQTLEKGRSSLPKKIKECLSIRLKLGFNFLVSAIFVSERVISYAILHTSPEFESPFSESKATRIAVPNDKISFLRITARKNIKSLHLKSHMYM